MGMTPTTSFRPSSLSDAAGIQSYDVVVQQTPQWQTATCCVGNFTLGQGGSAGGPI
ncbi:hypothetical protein XPA_001950 [Xanthoria parietina]